MYALFLGGNQVTHMHMDDIGKKPSRDNFGKKLNRTYIDMFGKKLSRICIYGQFWKENKSYMFPWAC